jgi:MinD-like ATPase involved in chromosome partitioning or flagellar assembly
MQRNPGYGPDPESAVADLDTPLWPPGQNEANEPAATIALTGERPLRPDDSPSDIEKPRTILPGPERNARIRRRREVQPDRWAQPTRRPLTSPKVIAVFSPKGGVGKSTTTLHLGQVLAMTRGDLIVALDANPHSGNLVKRVPGPHSTRTIGELCVNGDEVERYTDLAPYLTQTEYGLSVVRSDPSITKSLGEQDYRNVLHILSRFCSVTVVDLGTGVLDSAFLSIVDMADSVVGITTPSRDSAEVLAEGLAWLSERFPGKIANATVVINGAEPGPYDIDLERLTEELGRRVGRVLSIPRDRHLASAGVPQWPLLNRRTQDAYRELAGAVIDALPDDGRSPPSGGRGS